VEISEKVWFSLTTKTKSTLRLASALKLRYGLSMERFNQSNKLSSRSFIPSKYRSLAQYSLRVMQMLPGGIFRKEYPIRPKGISRLIIQGKKITGTLLVINLLFAIPLKRAQRIAWEILMSLVQLNPPDLCQPLSKKTKRFQSLSTFQRGEGKELSVPK
jgi:hypothetical protein